MTDAEFLKAAMALLGEALVCGNAPPPSFWRTAVRNLVKQYVESRDAAKRAVNDNGMSTAVSK